LVFIQIPYSPGVDLLYFFCFDIPVNGRFNNEAGDSYSTWTPRLLQAAFNYQYSTLSAGGYAHHPHYILQLLYDSIEDIGGSLSGLVRPE
jgi:hypothetical protein